MANARSRRIKESQAVLNAIGLPQEQRNQRAALTLLALLDLPPSRPWEAASNPLRGVTPKRLTELKNIFANSRAGPVFVTAFLNRRGLLKYLSDIAWETEIWVADAPDHMIHFNGERFLEPY